MKLVFSTVQGQKVNLLKSRLLSSATSPAVLKQFLFIVLMFKDIVSYLLNTYILFYSK